MASLRNLISYYKDNILDGIGFVAIWKEGRSWKAEYFSPIDGCWDDGFTFELEDTERMKEIYFKDHNSICINGYYNGFGDHEDSTSYYNTIPAILDRVLWMYQEHLNLLKYDFIDSFIIQKI